MLDFLAHDRWEPNAIALVDANSGATWTYQQLEETVAQLSELLPERKGMVLVLVRRDVPSLLAYLSSMRAGHAVFPIEANLDPSLLDGLVRSYEPDFILAGDEVDRSTARMNLDEYAEPGSLPRGISVHRRRIPHAQPIHPDLSLLLSTSGSTGSPKLVRLSAANVMANGEQIREALGIDEAERAITSLAFSYSFGLSVVHSHLLAGASLVVSDRNIMLRDFWNDVRDHSVTSFSGVPYSYELIRRIGFERMELPTLRTLAQAGGKLGRDMIRHYHEIMAERGGGFVVMYGQTEATARISVLPPELLPEKVGSVGFPLPGGHVEVRPLDDGSSAGQAGELVYSGPNVMMGYAENRDDLARGDELDGVLATGDSGYVDDDGCLYITGRLKRFAKVMGLRINLDEVEGKLQAAGPVAVLDGDDRLVVCCVPSSEKAVRESVLGLASRMNVHPRNFTIEVTSSFPQLPNGKIDYKTLKSAVLGPGDR